MSILDDPRVRDALRHAWEELRRFMATPGLEEIQQDSLAMAVASALAVANETAKTKGVNLAESLVTITEQVSPGGRLWRIHYGPRDYLHRRGGDLLVLVDEATHMVQRVLKGQ